MELQISQFIGENANAQLSSEKIDVQSALKDIRATLQRTKTLTNNINDAIIAAESIDTKESDESEIITENPKEDKLVAPDWINQNNNLTSQKNVNNSKESLNSSLTIGETHIKLISGDEEEADTDLETDRLLGQQRLDEQQGFDDNKVNL